MGAAGHTGGSTTYCIWSTANEDHWHSHARNPLDLAGGEAMSSRRECFALLDEAERLGCTVELKRKSNHFHVYDWNGRWVAACGSSPSDSKAPRALRAKLRREGVMVA